jgi:hypothetical protein
MFGTLKITWRIWIKLYATVLNLRLLISFHIIPCPCARNCTLHVERGQVVATWPLRSFRSSCVTYLARSDGGHLVPGICQVFLCITYIARSDDGHLVPGTSQVFWCYIFSEVRWWGYLVPGMCQVFLYVTYLALSCDGHLVPGIWHLLVRNYCLPLFF